MSTPLPSFSCNPDDAERADPDALCSDPLTLLGLWLQQRENHSPPPMTLSTVDAEGYPDSRTVLLSGYDDGSVRFHTDIRSRKATELAANPQVALVLLWPDADRQVMIHGDAEPMTAHESGVAYAAQSRYLQLLAWVNDAETAALPTEERRARWADFDQTHPDGSLAAPPTWIGYRVVARRITFWRSDSIGPSTRVEYDRLGESWNRRVLPG